MPPKRKASSAAAPASGPVKRPSKLAKEHNITAQQEAEIREAFGLFAEPMDGEKEGVLPTGDIRRAMIALGIAPSKSELAEFISILDPDEEGFAVYASFVAICALKMHARSNSRNNAEEVDEAFKLFTTHGQTRSRDSTKAPVITLAGLKRIAATLKEDVADDVLKDMLLEANGGAGVTAGVDRAAFESVMRRAGVW